jgi:hypothetical protein
MCGMNERRKYSTTVVFFQQTKSFPVLMIEIYSRLPILKSSVQSNELPNKRRLEIGR